MEALEQLKERLEQLIKQHKALKADHKKLTRLVASQQDKIAEQQQQIARQGVPPVFGALDDQTKIELRAQIDTLVGEIDNILLSLND